ncbi:MAG: LytTR family DNA-binding domain-containing protein [Lachnospiraceae bacterium]|nr:LytTR family DNA-binding domain-containing protein [Lachnospiraceae bacterium]MDD3614696.1 LytTR family DNA-binding domain-containing protein [Lachnospiraceae bacterium]
MDKKILICDDNEEVGRMLKKMLSKYGYSDDDVSTCMNMQQVEQLMESQNIDLIFMDIELGDENGVELAETIEKKYVKTPIVFITGYMEFAEDIFKAHPAYFIVKPVTEEKLEKALARVEEITKESREYLSIHLRGTSRVQKISMDEVYYVESQKRHILVHLSDEIIHTNMQKLDEFMEDVPKSLVRCHKSFALNLNNLEALYRDEALLKNGMRVPISRSKSQEVKQAFFQLFEH